MALTRSMLKGMNLTEEQVSAIIESHIETTDALKAARDSYKADAEELPKVRAELEQLKSDGGDWQKKYEKEHEDFEAYKADIQTKDTQRAVSQAYENLLKEAGVSEKRIPAIMKLVDTTSLEIEKDGTIKGAKDLSESIKTEWADFITSAEEKGAETKTPPENQGNAFEQMSLNDKMAYANEHPDDEMVKAWLG